MELGNPVNLTFYIVRKFFYSLVFVCLLFAVVKWSILMEKLWLLFWFSIEKFFVWFLGISPSFWNFFRKQRITEASVEIVSPCHFPETKCELCKLLEDSTPHIGTH